MPRLAFVIFFLTFPLEIFTQRSTCGGKYFARGVAPRGPPFQEDSRRVGICQVYKGKDYYFTLFDTKFRIPVYSAFQPARTPAGGQRTGRRRSGRWFVEHSLTEAGRGPQSIGHWPGSGIISTQLRDQLPHLQAIDDDYSGSGFNRGHLNPHFIQHGQDSRMATFTLTNAVPQDPCFNQGAWKRAEEVFDDVFVTFCHNSSGTVHVLTGAVPNYPPPGGEMWRTRTVSCGDNEDGCSTWRAEQEHDKYHRVNIPSRMWTAACCEFGNRRVPFFHWGRNVRDGRVLMNVGFHELRHFEHQLRQWYYAESGREPIQLFDGACYSGASGGELENQLRAALKAEVADNANIVVGEDLRSLPDREEVDLMTIDLSQELDPVLLHGMGRHRDMEQLTRRIYGLLATGKYYVKCVDPIQSAVHTHEVSRSLHRAKHALGNPTCTLSMSYEPTDPIPDLANLKPPFPLPEEPTGVVSMEWETCGTPVTLGTGGRVTSDAILGDDRSGAACQLRLTAPPDTFVSGTFSIPFLPPGQYIDLYDGSTWTYRFNVTGTVPFISAQNGITLRLTSRRIDWVMQYNSNNRTIHNQDRVVLIDHATCSSLTYPYRKRSWPHVRFYRGPAGAGLHTILMTGAAGAPVVSSSRVRLRTAETTDAAYDILYATYASNIYYDKAEDSRSQVWVIDGYPRVKHGSQITLENVRYERWYFGLKDRSSDDGGVFTGKLCQNMNRWVIFRVPPGIEVRYAGEMAGFEAMARGFCSASESKPRCQS